MKKSVEIQLDKARNLRFGMGALITIEEKLKAKITEIDFNNLGMKDLAIFVFAGLKHEDKTLTLEKTIEIIDDYSSINDIAKTLGEAMNLSFNGDNLVEKK